MTTRIVGLIRLLDAAAFEQYRQGVGPTVADHGGTVAFRGAREAVYWNELGCGDFDAYVELQFPDSDAARRWAESPAYQALLPIRNQAMQLTLFAVA